MVHGDKSVIHSYWHTKTVIAHQGESAFRSQLKKAEIESAFPDKIGTVSSVQVPMNQNQDVLIISQQNQNVFKHPLGVPLRENVQEDSVDENYEKDDKEYVKNDEASSLRR